MAASNIHRALAQSFELASAELIDRVRDAIGGFYANPPQDWQTWENWRTPKPWETRVLPNLERYHNDLRAALRAYDAGDVRPITRAAASYAGLSRDLEFDMSWMTEESRAALQKTIEQVVTVADRIHRLGFDLLNSSGRTGLT